LLQFRMAKVVVRVAAVAVLAGALGALPTLAQDTAPVAVTAATQPVESVVPPAEVPAPMADDAVAATKAALPVAPKVQHDLTPMGMFLAADPIVQGVMILLAAASVVTWTILLMKGLGLLLAKRRMRASIAVIREAGTLSEALAKVRPGVARHLLSETEDEMGLSRGLPSEGVKESVQIALQRVETTAARGMATGTGMLATIGSIGPFVGLFGTVWGIMRSFIGIAQSNTTNLAVVATGIAEALLATGIGLVAAIPAVVIYNSLTRSIGAYRVMTGDAVALILRHLSRELDRRESGSYAQKHAGARLAAE
jgi:biopolymer transport protein ExbB